MVANVSPSEAAFEDTYKTLTYAVRAKTIKSKVSIHSFTETIILMKTCFDLLLISINLIA